MTGKTVIVTGANSGVGLATARTLAGVGARVVFAVRSTEKGRAAANTTPGKTEVRALDLASIQSVRAFAADWEGPMDFLINNAAAPPPAVRRRTADGFELQFGTDHLGHFALTNLLIEHVVDRVVTLSSQAERFAPHRLQRPRLGEPLQTGRAPTAGPSWPTSYSAPNCSAAWRPPGSAVPHGGGTSRASSPPRSTREAGAASKLMVRLIGQSAPNKAPCPSCTRPSPTFPGTSSQAQAGSCTCAGLRRSSPGPPLRGTSRSRAVSGPSQSS